MKKIAVGALVGLLSFSTWADIAISWDSTTYFVLSDGNSANYPGDYLPVDALHLLIWSASAPSVVNYAQPGTGIGAGEFVLWSSEEADRGNDDRFDSGRFDYTFAPIVSSDSDVGNQDINAGYVYSRIFESSNPVDGEWYFQSPAFLGPGITAYDPLNPITTLLTHKTSDGADAGILQMGVGDNMYQVIPEPSVFALLGLGGLFVILRRRFVTT